MSQPVKVGVALIAAVVGIIIVLKIVGTIESLLIPLAILGGLGLVVYGLVWKGSSLPGGRRYLP